MDKNKKPEQDDPAQSQRFVETAKELGVEESGKSFSRVFKKITPASKVEKLKIIKTKKR